MPKMLAAATTQLPAEGGWTLVRDYPSLTIFQHGMPVHRFRQVADIDVPDIIPMKDEEAQDGCISINKVGATVIKTILRDCAVFKVEDVLFEFGIHGFTSFPLMYVLYHKSQKMSIVCEKKICK